MICYEDLKHGDHPRCMVNAALEHEKEFAIKKAERIKNVIVIGAGPAGMEAARAAALRGHRVTLYDKQKKLGGSLNHISVIKGCRQENFLTLINYYKHQLHELGVQINTGREFTTELLETLKPDAVIIASGGVHVIPDIPGIDKKIVVSSRTLHNYLTRALRYFGVQRLRELTDIWMPVGKRVVIIGGSRYGCEIAEFLVNRGRKVTVLESGRNIGEGLTDTLCKPRLINWLEENGVTFESGVTFKEITNQGISIVTEVGQKLDLKANTIITALPLDPDETLYESLKGKVNEVYRVGDCASPALIVDAVAAGFKTGREI